MSERQNSKKRSMSIGIFAHVDAGKTTLSEQILFKTGALRALGRVDRGDTAMDTDQIERERGITVFSDQAVFEHGGRRYTLIDTPGHVDFAAEAERAMAALDAAVLLVDSTSGVRPHAVLLARLARKWNVPVLLFLNKCDLAASNPERAMEQAAQRLEADLVPLPADPERVAELDEEFLEKYLEGGFSDADCAQALSRAFVSGAAMPVLKGSAMTGDGVEELLSALDSLLPEAGTDDAALPLDARVYKVRRDPKGKRVVYVKVAAGRISPRDVFTFGEQVEKIHEIRIYRGNRFELAEEALPGDAVGLVGLSVPKCGDRLQLVNGERTCTERTSFETQPALAAKVTALDGTNDSAMMEKLRLLEDEDSQLGVTYDTSTKEILVRIMGPVQLEILESLLMTRFNVKASFSPPRVLYKETISAPVMGYGHYEPLRHYAETNVRLEPAPRGSGISFESECHVDDLTVNYQNLIRTHVFERAHRGVLTGSELTDVKVVLVAGRAHLKHTEGGDFREATYRAIRQGLMYAQNVLLEPYYRFEILVPSEFSGRVMSDIPAMAGEFDAPETLGSDVRIRGRGPVATFSDYSLTLRAATHGEGSAMFLMDGYDVCHNADEVIGNIGYDPNADLEQPTSSVFCSHGAGFTVLWNEAESWMHCPKMK
ncbi:MAG: TetM/TetW/TetO/TetS family tetracycline resistance ribosomal protection protein [Clostridia bacterium]|nr:TetM/TetW/TetO/TetS family tetracycline resistance ribosomal protection protein [Clostridia bacterium]